MRSLRASMPRQRSVDALRRASVHLGRFLMPRPPLVAPVAAFSMFDARQHALRFTRHYMKHYALIIDTPLRLIRLMPSHIAAATPDAASRYYYAAPLFLRRHATFSAASTPYAC